MRKGEMGIDEQGRAYEIVWREVHGEMFPVKVYAESERTEEARTRITTPSARELRHLYDKLFSRGGGD